MKNLSPASAPRADVAHKICPHCWEVNPGAFALCARCGADMSTILQESAGMRRTAAVQSPVPVAAAKRLGVGQRIMLGVFIVMMALSYGVYLLPQRGPVPSGPTPASATP